MINLYRLKNKLHFGFLAIIFFMVSCEQPLEEKAYDKFTESTFYQTAEDAELAVTSVYSRLNQSGYSIYGVGLGGIAVQSSATTDEMVCSWGDAVWIPFYQVNFSEDFPSDGLGVFYNTLMPAITNATITIEKLGNMEDISDELKSRYIAEVKALRAHYAYILYSHYGPVPLRLDPEEAENPDAEAIPRLSKEEMVSQIEKDYEEAFEYLPNAFEQSGSDYGRMTKEISLMGRLKLYMHEKQWYLVKEIAKELMGMGHSLQNNYADIFTYENNGNPEEVIFAVPTKMDTNSSNLWLAHALPGNYSDPSGKDLTQWGGYKMPWKTYDKFDSQDERLERLLVEWETDDGELFNARTNGYEGAIPMKYGVDPNSTSESMGVNIIVWRYSDVLLSLAEAINETEGPTSEAYDLINQVRNRAGLKELPAGLSNSQFSERIMDERLFEFWNEGGIRREDLIRWDKFVERAEKDGSPFIKPEFELYPIPRKVISESNGVVKQNPGY